MGFLDYSGLSHFLDKLKTIFVGVDEKGAASGVATLDSNAIVPKTQLPDVNSCLSVVNGKLCITYQKEVDE